LEGTQFPGLHFRRSCLSKERRGKPQNSVCRKPITSGCDSRLRWSG